MRQSTAENFLYGELGRRPCQIRFRWRQVKFWNRLIGLPQRRLHIKPYTLLSNLFNNSSFVRNTKIHQRKLPSCLIGASDTKSQTVILTPRLREIFINCLISCGTNRYWKLQTVTGNSMLRTCEKFGNTLFDGLPEWFAPILVMKGDYS